MAATVACNFTGSTTVGFSGHLSKITAGLPVGLMGMTAKRSALLSRTLRWRRAPLRRRSHCHSCRTRWAVPDTAFVIGLGQAGDNLAVPFNRLPCQSFSSNHF
jgi:hypothetical protein